MKRQRGCIRIFQKALFAKEPRVFRILIVLSLLILAHASYAEEHTLQSPYPLPWLRDKVVILKAMAGKGDPDAQYQLGKIYLNGFEDPKEAYKWFGMAAEGYRKAAEKGDADAQYHLGDMMYHGFTEGGTEDAARWFYRAGQQGNAEAMALALRLNPSLVNGDHPSKMEDMMAKVKKWKADREKAENTNPSSSNGTSPTPVASPPASK